VYPVCLLSSSGELLLHRVLQSFCSSEFWNSHCWNLYSFTSSWISCFSSISHLGFKDTETCDWNLCPVFHCCFDAAKDSVYCSFSVSLCSVKYFVHFADDICFIHSSEFILRAINLWQVGNYFDSRTAPKFMWLVKHYIATYISCNDSPHHFSVL